jgi:hypothetical protein
VLTHDSVNFSPTKQKFSFAKNQRFSLPVADLKSKGDFNYDLPSTLRSRRASFGIGERFRNAASTRNRKLPSLLFRQEAYYFVESPEPATYNIVGGFTNGEFRTVLPKTNYYSFGLGASREAYDNVYMPGNNSPRLKETKNMPGPGEY